MIKIEIENCNNIESANIEIKEDTLNIRYAMNGTGKSTIGQAIKLLSEKKPLDTLKTFGNTKEPKGKIPDSIRRVLLFNEDFVNNIVFKESEVIQNAFEVFIKSEEYEEKQNLINQRLKEIHIDTSENQDLNRLLTTGQTVLVKFTKTKSNELKQTGLIKNLTNAENIFKLPEPIKKFQPLMDKDYNVEWVGWKNDGANFDDTGICPFCTTTLDEKYANEKQIFTTSYSKSNVKSIKEMLSYIDAVKDFMDSSKLDSMYRCIKDTEDEQTIKLWIKKFYIDLEYLVEKIKKVIEFNSYKVKSEDLARLEEHLKGLIIDSKPLEIFNNKLTLSVISQINDKIHIIISETETLKKDIGILKGLVGSAIKKSVIDINNFLDMAGINYRLEIRHNNENDTKAILKYVCKSRDEIPVDDIKLHLSWGERNAFALVLFMHYAFSKNPDLIILDDPISSFDSNKKYAIINRLFLNNPKMKSLYKKTVIMLTHDFQPIIDFIINNKPNGGSVNAWFLRNKNGKINEIEITQSDIKSLPIILSESASNEYLNKVHRIISLRKLLEFIKWNRDQEIAYNLLSCLLHGNQTASLSDGTPIVTTDIKLGEQFIYKYITDFSFKDYCTNVFNRNSIIGLYKQETNTYFKLQIFRVLLAIADLRSRIDDPLLKYIDEQFHVENDYIFYLDLNKYDIVPDFVIPKCDEFLFKEKVIKTGISA
jgi:ABC-type dipeptide/oligopeptide/nickel transport system ATPase subunit